MSKVKLWKPFSLFMVLLLMSSLMAVVPATPVQANVSGVTVNPYDTAIIGLNTGYRITMTTGASLNSGDNITIEFPPGTGVAGMDWGYCSIRDFGVSGFSLNGQQVTVTIPNIAPIIPGEQFAINFGEGCGITNPSTSGSRTVTVWTTVEPIHVTSSSYEITAVKVYTGATKHSENATITGAIAAAIAGDTIIVPAGTYNTASGESFPLLLDRVVTIKSLSGASATRIEPTSDNLSGFNVTAANVTIGGSNSGFTITAGGRGGIYADVTGGNGITVQGCIFKSTSDHASRGMWFEKLWNGALITGNSFAVPRLGTGIQVINADGATISNNTVAAGTLYYCFLTFKAEAFYPTRDAASPYAEYVAETPSTIGDVLVTGNSIMGIRLPGENGQAIRFAASTKSCDHGCPQAQDLTVGTSGVTISGNTFTNNNGQAVKIDADTDKTCVDPYIDRCSPNTATAHIYGAGNIHINNNNFTGNTVVGVDNGTTTTVDAKQNYWGHASGPSHLSPVVVAYGDNVTASVTFQPWLVTAYTGAPPVGEIAITTTSPLPDGQTGVAYSKIFSASGGSGPYTWAYYSGIMPPDLSFTGSNFSGTPTVIRHDPGFNFAVQVNDGVQATYKDFAMPVYVGVPVITTTSLPNGTINVPYGPQTLHAIGGTGSYTWSPNTGTLPTGLTLASDGKISGTPTAAGTFSFNVRVVSDGGLGYKDLSITINAPPSGGQKLIGADAGSTFTSVASGGYFALAQFTAEATGDITQIRVKCASSGNIKVAIYSDNISEPGNLLPGAFTGSTAVVAGWNTITFPSTHVIASTKYWLARNSDGSMLYWKAQPGSLFRYKTAAFSGSFPSSAGTGFGTDQLYHLMAGWAAPNAPTVFNTGGATSITATSATLNGAITATGGENPTVIIYWGGTDGGTTVASWENNANLGTMGAITFSKDISGLTGGTLYYYRCFAANSGGTAWTATSDNFTTSALGAPTVTNSVATSVTATSATLNGAITDTGGENPTVIIYWGDNDGVANQYNWDNSVNLGTKGTGTFYRDITDLTRGTKYYYRCFASNSYGGTWAASDNFTTLSGGYQKLIGAAVDSTFTNVATGGYFALAQFTAESSGDITELRVRCASGGNIMLAIYADNSGEPGNLLNAVNTPTLVSAGWITIPFPSTHVDAGTKYWLARNSDGSMLYWQSQPGTRFRYKAAAFSGFSFPSSAGAGFGTGEIYHLVAGWGTFTLPAPPVPPVIVTPKTTITFEWGASSGATKYRLQVNTLSDFTGTSMFDAEVSTTSQAVTLTVGTPYYWRVKAGNSGGWSGWSSTGSVTP